jgi:hypothetical protein
MDHTGGVPGADKQLVPVCGAGRLRYDRGLGPGGTPQQTQARLAFDRSVAVP